MSGALAGRGTDKEQEKGRVDAIKVRVGERERARRPPARLFTADAAASRAAALLPTPCPDSSPRRRPLSSAQQVKRYRAGRAPEWAAGAADEEAPSTGGGVDAVRTAVAAPVVVKRADDPRLARLQQSRGDGPRVREVAAPEVVVRRRERPASACPPPPDASAARRRLFPRPRRARSDRRLNLAPDAAPYF